MKKYKIRGTYAQFFLRCGLYCFLAFIFFQSLAPPYPPHKGSAVFLNIGLTPPHAVPPPTWEPYQRGRQESAIRNKAFESQGMGTLIFGDGCWHPDSILTLTVFQSRRFFTLARSYIKYMLHSLQIFRHISCIVSILTI